MPKVRRIGGVRRWAGWFCRCLIGLWLLTLVQVAIFRFVNPPSTLNTVWMFIRGAQRPPEFIWTPLAHISPHLRKAVLAGEDQRFLTHRGFDFIELNQALKDLALKRGTRGASTITMQTARTLFLWPDRGWIRKLAEAYYTVLIEGFWPKKRILEVYLNLVDWGETVMGAEAASQCYFHKSCGHLSRSQAAMLAAILPNPRRWSPVHPTRQVLKRQKRILHDMRGMPSI